jgi:hypothetical protein
VRYHRARLVISPPPTPSLLHHTDAEASVSDRPNPPGVPGRESGPVPGTVVRSRVDSFFAATPRPEHLFRSRVSTDPSEPQPQQQPQTSLSPGNFQKIDEQLRKLKERSAKIYQKVHRHLEHRPLQVMSFQSLQSFHEQVRSSLAGFASRTRFSVLDPSIVPEPSRSTVPEPSGPAVSKPARPDADRCLGCHVWDKVCIQEELGKRILTSTGQPWCVECRKNNMSRCFPTTPEDRERLDQRCVPCVADHTAGYDCGPTYHRPCPRCQERRTIWACENRK